MTDYELRKMKRADLLEMLIAAAKENETLRARVQELEQKLEMKELRIKNSGSIAEASLQLNGVFEAVQAAADQYLDNIARMEREAEQHLRDAESIISVAEEKAESMLNDSSNQGKINTRERVYQ